MVGGITTMVPGRMPRRGVAEIELMLIICVIITLLMLTRGAMQLGLARLNTAETAIFEATNDATDTRHPPMYTDDPSLQAVTGYTNLRPGLPNRTHVIWPQSPVTIYTGDRQPLSPFTVSGKAAMISPAWAYSGYPVGEADVDAIAQWFDDYVSESHEELIVPLGLAPAWRP
ncbi:MAG: hypothetical protein ABSH20_16580 [Tepidisphaeraceae bacterium]|jgi:hypothetical protein